MTRRREDIDSPCVNICMLHPDTGLCVGCARSGDEIARWRSMSPAERSVIMAALPYRTSVPRTRRGGRRARRKPE
ncbi:MAG: DUF1289 domain-containing protein [Rhodobacteraceae bacterium]|nr:DUF1289 domain-containing protein [Paracoccaceae bacterium]